MSAARTSLRVLVESTPKRAFASVLGWPGWARPGKTEETALEAVLECRDRYALVVAAAGLDARALQPDLEVVERLPGDMTTEFGAPSAIGAADRQPLTAAAARREVALLEAAWEALDAVAKRSPEALRKGPRGGGRDRSAMLDHVDGAEAAYARKLGVRAPKPLPAGANAAALIRADLVAVLAQASDGEPLVERGWPPRYATRRIAWHVLDHAWEMTDRAT